MTLFARAAFEEFVLALPAVTVVEQWEALVAKVGGKVFALVAAEGGAVTFKVSEIAFVGLTTLDGVGQAPYFAKGGWVRVEARAELPEADLAAYLHEAHRLVAAKLTKKARAELGLGP